MHITQATKTFNGFRGFFVYNTNEKATAYAMALLEAQPGLHKIQPIFMGIVIKRHVIRGMPRLIFTTLPLSCKRGFT